MPVRNSWVNNMHGELQGFFSIGHLPHSVCFRRAMTACQWCSLMTVNAEERRAVFKSYSTAKKVQLGCWLQDRRRLVGDQGCLLESIDIFDVFLKFPKGLL